MTEPIYTLGHSTRSRQVVEQLLRAHGIGVLADVRRFPRSRQNPQFNRDVLAQALSELGVQYVWLTSLGGRRHSRAWSPLSAGWRNPSFRAFAEYMQTHEFDAGLQELMDLAHHAPLAMMCAETLPWRCHRSLIADALAARGFEVVHILSDRQMSTHHLTPFAQLEGVRVTYPATC